jgi:glycosyltransferase involved in cell wall biosynthesis
MRIALAHDWLVGMRGGERVLDRLARLAQERTGEPPPIYTLVADGKPLSPTLDTCPTTTSPLQSLPGATGRLRRWYLPLYPWAVGKLRPAACEILLSTSSAAIKGITPPPGAVHVCYCHSPARYIWSRPEQYGRGLKRLGLALARRPFRRWDRRTCESVDHFVANSSYTAGQIAAYFGRESVVIHPPVRTEFFTPDPQIQRTDALVVVSALEPYKRVDIAIEAANRLGLPLLVAGDGSQFRRLHRLAGPTVTMLGRVDDETVRDLYRMSSAFVFPAVEDFGIAPVEAMACGTPVVALQAGGALDTVNDRTGVFFAEQSARSLGGALRQVAETRFDHDAIRRHAERFSEACFERRFAALLEQLEEHAATKPLVGDVPVAPGAMSV